MILDLRHGTHASHSYEPRPLVDGQGRRIHHLRLSVISACNLRCIYCQPKAEGQGVRVLSDAQRVDFVRFLHQRHALAQVRLTGGEPLLYPRLLTLIRSLREISPDLILAMTTNAQGLASCAADLRRAGLDRLNISIDTLEPQRYRALTGGEVAPVLEGIEAALAAGFSPPKLNSVVLRGENDDDLSALVDWAFARGCEMRFLEAMPIGPAAETNRRLFVSADEIYGKLTADFDLKPLGLEFGATALRFRATGAAGTGVIGLVAPMTKPFCGSCGRVRLTSDGKLFPCLLDDRFADLRPAWSGDTFDPQLGGRLLQSVIREKHPEGGKRQSATMVSLGG